jgi:hypothetical protein
MRENRWISAGGRKKVGLESSGGKKNSRPMYWIVFSVLWSGPDEWQ